MINLLDEVATHRKVIKYDSVAFSLYELVEMHRRGEIIIQPEYQRLFRWTREQQSNFIESLLLEIPIPPLFFYENETGIWELLDGLQRISTLIRFFSGGEIPHQAVGVAGNEQEWHYTHVNDIDKPLQLLRGRKLTSLEGLSMQTLPVQLQLNLKRLRQLVYILKRETHPSFKYEIFSRLNRGGSQIEDQELRNASMRLLGDKFPNFLQAAAKNPDFVSALGLSDADLRNGYIDELALRFFATKNRPDAFRHDVEEFLTEFMEEVTKGTLVFNYESEEVLFGRVWKVINAAATGGTAVCSKRPDGGDVGPFSPSIFEMLTAGVIHNLNQLERLPPEQVKQKIISAILDGKRSGIFGAGSNSRVKFGRRLDFGRAAFAA